MYEDLAQRENRPADEVVSELVASGLWTGASCRMTISATGKYFRRASRMSRHWHAEDIPTSKSWMRRTTASRLA